MSFNRGDIVSSMPFELWVIDHVGGLGYINIANVEVPKLCGTVKEQDYTLVKAAKTGERIRFKYDSKVLTGTVINELDDGSLVVDSDGPEGMIIGLPLTDITHKTNGPNYAIWEPCAEVTKEDIIKEFEDMLDDTPPPIPAPCFTCTDFEQASGWIVGKITFECKICGRLKE